LRKKLDPNDELNPIETVRGCGYLELLKVERRVLLCVQGDEEDGEDSALFVEMGFVPRSQRRRARRRTGNGVTAPSPASASAAAPPPTQPEPEKVT
jgi:hypothetical protein